MDSKNILKTGFVAIALAMVCSTASAHRWPRFHRFHRTVTVVTRPAITVKVTNRLTQKERLQMALAYLHSNESLSIKQYAKMTGLSKDAAEAELDVFALDKDAHIAVTWDRKKKLYTLAK